MTTQYPWYVYQDIKIVNESRDTNLEKFCLYPVLRGQLDELSGEIRTGFNGLVDSHRPWDQQQGTAMESAGYTGFIEDNSGLTVCSVMAWEAGNGTDRFVNFCTPTANSGSSIPGLRYSYREKFPHPATVADVAQRSNGARNVVNYFQGTRQDAAGDYSFIESSQVVLDDGLWTQSNVSKRMILPSGSYGMYAGPSGSFETMPRPGTIFCRVVHTYRDFSHPYFLNSFRDDVEEIQGQKAWTLRMSAKYYDGV
jgi:hypothetical protein